MKQFIYTYFIATFVICFANECISQDLDNTFGTNGKSIVDINNKVQAVNTVKVQVDGKILVCGNNFTPNEYFVIRQNTNGTLDNTFDSDGILAFTVPGAGTDGISYTMALQSDGKILIGGTSDDGTNIESVVVRLNTDGSFDNTFGTNGFVRFDISAGYSEGINNILVLPGGKMKVIGEATFNGTTASIYIAQLNSDGSFDTSFDTDGKLSFSGNIGSNQVVLQSDYKVVMCDGNIVQRINADGTPDNSFGVNSVATITGINILSLTLLESNKIVVAGDSLSYFAVARLNTNGTIDNTFGTNGKNIFTPVGMESATNLFRSVAEDTSNNRIIAGGYSFYSQFNTGYMSVVEFLPTGVINHYTSIKVSPITTGFNHSEVYSLLIQADRKIVLAGPEGNASNDDIAVVRLNADFNTFVTTDIMSSEQLTTGINLFPNPASQTLNIHSIYTIENIKITDVLGNEIRNLSSSGNTQLDISSLPKGLYNFVITTDKGTGNKKVSVQ